MAKELRFCIVGILLQLTSACGDGASVPPDTGVTDAVVIDAGDAAPVDATTPDATLPDATLPDATTPDATTPDAAPTTLTGEAWCADGGVTLNVNGAFIPIQGSGSFAVLAPDPGGVDITIETPPLGKQCNVQSADGLAGFGSTDIIVRCWGAPSFQLGYVFDTLGPAGKGPGVFHTLIDEDGCSAPSTLIGPEPLALNTVRTLRFSGDRQWLLYTAKAVVPSFATVLYAAPVSATGAGTPILVTPDPTSSAGVSPLRTVPNSPFVFYKMNPNGSAPGGYYYSNLSTSPFEPPIYLSNPDLGFSSGSYLGTKRHASEDGTRFMFTHKPPTSPSSPHTWIVNLDGGEPFAPQRVNHSPGPGAVFTLSEMSNDGTRVAYNVTEQQVFATETYISDVSGVTPTTPVKLHPDLGDGEGSDFESFTPDSQRVILRRRNDGTRSLVIVDVSLTTPGTPEVINAPLIPFGTFDDVVVSPDSQKLVYTAESTTNGTNDLYYVDISEAIPGTPVKVGPTLPDGANLSDFRWASNSQSFAYLGNPVAGEGSGVYWVNVSTGIPDSPVRVHAPLPEFGRSVGSPLFGPGDRGILFLSDIEIGGKRELYWVGLSGNTVQSPVKINADLAAGGQIQLGTGVSSVYGDFIVYETKSDVTFVEELFVVAIPGFVPMEAKRVTLPPPAALGPPLVRFFDTSPL